MDRHFGNYILHERVGIGGMGEVFRATKQGPDGFKVLVALKVILPHLAREESFQDRFSREAKLAASLKHPNIVDVNNFNIIDETPFIEMEYVPGTDLRRVLRSLDTGERLPLNESIAILYAVARGLSHAHCHDGRENNDAGVIHCDLNPHNILLSTLGEVKVADFGIARAVHGDSAASATVRGKLAYMSPEQMEGRELDRRTDLFSFGIIAYQLLSGNHPFERGSEGATIAAIGKAQYLPLCDAAQDLPTPLYELVEQLLSLDPVLRPTDMASTLEILEPLVLPSAATALASRIVALGSGTSDTIGTVPGASPTPPTMHRTRWPRLWRYLVATGIVGVFLVAGIVFLSTDRKTDRAQLPEADTVTNVPSVEPEFNKRHPVINNVTVESVPQGAEILVGGIPLGTAPVVIEAGPGDEAPDLEARLFGYYNKSFQFPSGTVDRFVVTLVPLPTGTVRISARPWARVNFRGEDMGETPVFIEKVPVGQHSFVLDYEPLGVKREITRKIMKGMNTVSVDMRE